MKTETKGFYHFYEGPKFDRISIGPYKEWLEYELKEDSVKGSMIVSSRRVGFLNGAVVRRMIDYKKYLQEERASEPKGVISVGTMISWAESQL